ncbi:MAG: hypothetical protein R3240_02605 [Gammaproteobacteria bacterium]|nr:hypothetical protein [Gammaproteobacteria bacterium]
MKSSIKKYLFSLFVLFLFVLLQSCAMGPTKEQKREMAFNLVFNVLTVKAAAAVYSVTNLFSFGTNTAMDHFDAIAESDKDKAREFAALAEEMPSGLMKTVSKLRPKAKDLIFKKPEYIDKFVDTPIYAQGVKMAKQAHRFGLPDLTREMDDKQIALWMHVFVSSKNKVKSIAEPLSDWSKQANKYFDIDFNPKSWI